MIFLGISGGLQAGNQDGAACIIKDGSIIAAAEEERFCGQKHAPGRLPIKAVASCLEISGLTMNDVDSISFPGSTYDGFKEKLSSIFSHYFGCSPVIELVEHHKAHAAQAFYSSPFESAAVLTMDYSGDSKSTVIWKADRLQGLKELKCWSKPESLGLFYSAITQYLGFQRDMDEYKVMGLAAYGNPNVDMNPLMKIVKEGYSVNPAFYDARIRSGVPDIPKQEPLYSKKFEDHLPVRRLQGEDILEIHKNIAASAQKHLEDAFFELANIALKLSGEKSLCMAGGVSLNASAAGKLLASNIITDGLWIPCGPSDAGLAVGAAMLASLSRGIRPLPSCRADYGPEPSESEIDYLAQKNGLKPCESSYGISYAAKQLSKGKVLAICSGGMEFGPRALGQRSIIASAETIELRDHINKNIKCREMWRPLAPCVIEESASEYFEVEAGTKLPFMTAGVKVRKTDKLKAVTHVDGTARIQTVGENIQPLRSILEEYQNLTGLPVLLNTSLNLRGWPISTGAREAMACFAGGGIDLIILGNRLFTRS